MGIDVMTSDTRTSSYVHNVVVSRQSAFGADFPLADVRPPELALEIGKLSLSVSNTISHTVAMHVCRVHL